MPALPDDSFTGPASLLASMAALVTALWKGRGKNGVHTKVAVLENEMKNIDRRLTTMDEKLDRLIDRR